MSSPEPKVVIPAKPAGSFWRARAGIHRDWKAWIPAFAGMTAMALFSMPAGAGVFVGPGGTGADFLKVPVTARAASWQRPRRTPTRRIWIS